MQFQNCFFLDSRSFFLSMRLLGLLVFADGASRISSLTEHYSDTGIYPVKALMLDNSPFQAGSVVWRLLLVSGTTWWQALMLGFYTLAGLLLAAGRQMILSALIAWFLLGSIIARAPTLINGGDTLLRLVLFWAVLILLESRLNKRSCVAPGHDLLSGTGVVGLTFQIAFLYWFSAVIKNHPSWRVTFTAVGDALALGSLRTPLGGWLAQFPQLAGWATHATIWLEELGPFLLFVPLAWWRWRLLGVVVFIIFHLGMLAPAMRLGWFPYVCACVWLAFLPPQFWDKLMRGNFLLRMLSQQRRCPWSGSEWSRLPLLFLTRLAAITGIVYMIAWNVTSLLPPEHTTWFTSTVKAPGTALGLRQNWALFAARPSTRDGWMVAEARLESGRVVDLFTGRSPQLYLPINEVGDRYPSFRWRKHLVTLFLNNRPHATEALRNFLVRRWEDAGNEPVAEVRIFFCYRDSTRKGEGVLRTDIYPSWQQPPAPADQPFNGGKQVEDSPL